MNPGATVARPLAEVLDLKPAYAVPDDEYHRLLGYPRGRELSERANELARGAREWFAVHGRPWIYWREIALELGGAELRLDGTIFHAARLRELLARSRAERALIVLASAGARGEEQARRLWEDDKPDEYFFLESFSSAVVEQLVATASGAICATAEAEGWRAVPHYSPGYSGWEVGDQVELFELARRGATSVWPEPVEVLSSGMLRPKKSQLAIVGLRRRVEGEAETGRASPCENCSLGDCRYRRRPNRRLRAPLPAETSAS